MSERGERILACLDGVFRLVLGGIFVYAGWEKIQDPAMFATQVAAYRMLPDVCVGLFALVLPMVELVAGVVLIATKWPREAALLLLGLLAMFFVGLTQAMARGLKISCGCFGGGSEEEGLGAALLRDVVLLFPTVWLALRPNRWLNRRLPVLGFVCLLVAGAGWWAWSRQAEKEETKVTEGDAALFDMSFPASDGTNTVVAERWTTDFPTALAEARKTHRPILMFAGEQDCRFCQLMEGTLTSKAFSRWVRGTGIYLTESHVNETNAHVAQHYQLEFLKALPHHGKLLFPCIGVYWPQARTNDDVRLTFTARRGHMPGKKHAALIGEFVNSMDVLLGDYFGTLGRRPSLEEIMGYATRQINVKAADGSKVWMQPESGEQVLGSVVKLFVKPPASGLRKIWLDPTGKPVPHQNNAVLVVNDDMPAGTYTIVFEKLNIPKTRKKSSRDDSSEKDEEHEKE